MAVLSTINSIVGGQRQAKAATNAAADSSAAQLQMFDRSREDQAFYSAEGQRRQGEFYGQGRADVYEGIGEAGRQIGGAGDASRNFLLQGIGTARADNQPFLTQGTNALMQISNLNGLNGTDAQNTAMGQFTTSPGYQFRLNEGLEAVQNSAAARGSLASGNTFRALQDRGDGLAAAEYDAYYGRVAGLAGMGADTAARTSQQALAGAGALSENAQQTGQALANVRMNGANALANGAFGAGANAVGQAQNTANALTAVNTSTANGLSSAAMTAGGQRGQAIAGQTAGIQGGINSLAGFGGYLSGGFGGGGPKKVIG